MTTAPTPEFILSAGFDFSIYCDRCRLMVAPKDLALSIIAAGKGEVPVDRLKFKCTRCGGPGVPYVTGDGNLLLGRPRVWPPEG